MSKSKTFFEILQTKYFNDKSKALDSFGVVFVYTLITLSILLLVDVGATGTHERSQFSALLVYITSGATFLYSLRASGVNKHVRRIWGVVFVVGSIASLLAITFARIWPERVIPGTAQTFSIFWVIIAIITPFATIFRLGQHKEVTKKTLFAAISAYLQISIAFTYMYIYISSVSGGSFFETIEPTTSYAYFSLTTITTLGYGDLFSIHVLGRALSVFEALIGQVYLVTVVAMLVGLFANKLQSKRRSQS